MATMVHPETQAKKDFLPLNGTDYVEFYVATRGSPPTTIGSPLATSW